MKRALILSTMTGGAALALTWIALSPASLTAGQRGPAVTPASANAASAGPVPRLADGHPDLSGVWWSGGDVGGRGYNGGGARGGARGTPAPTFPSLYKPEAAAQAKKLSDKDDPTLKCIPTAFGTLNVRLWDVG